MSGTQSELMFHLTFSVAYSYYCSSVQSSIVYHVSSNVKYNGIQAVAEEISNSARDCVEQRSSKTMFLSCFQFGGISANSSVSYHRSHHFEVTFRFLVSGHLGKSQFCTLQVFEMQWNRHLNSECSVSQLSSSY